jgi:hypothetical protein
MLASRNAWEAMSCPGMGKGNLHPMEEIDLFLDQQRAEPIIERQR